MCAVDVHDSLTKIHYREWEFNFHKPFLQMIKRDFLECHGGGIVSLCKTICSLLWPLCGLYKMNSRGVICVSSVSHTSISAKEANTGSHWMFRDNSSDSSGVVILVWQSAMLIMLQHQNTVFFADYKAWLPTFTFHLYFSIGGIFICSLPDQNQLHRRPKRGVKPVENKENAVWWYIKV